jgi:ribosome-associated protein
MIPITPQIVIGEDELEFKFVRASGPGGQNVNKVASAIHLRFDIAATASLSDPCKQRLLALNDQRVSSDGVLVIKAQQYRSQEKNKADALERLKTLIQSALVTRKPRKISRPSKAAKRKRVDNKTRRGQLKKTRGKIEPQ